MTGYRDERDALRARVDELERKLEASESRPSGPVALRSASPEWARRLLGAPVRYVVEQRIADGLTEVDVRRRTAGLAEALTVDRPAKPSVVSDEDGAIAWESSREVPATVPVWFAKVHVGGASSSGRLVAGFEHRRFVFTIALFLAVLVASTVFMIRLWTLYNLAVLGFVVAAVALAFRVAFTAMVRKRATELENALHQVWAEGGLLRDEEEDAAERIRVEDETGRGERRELDKEHFDLHRLDEDPVSKAIEDDDVALAEEELASSELEQSPRRRTRG